MLNAKETKELLRDFVWENYEFWSNELGTDNDNEVWPKVIEDLKWTNHDPYSPNGEGIDQAAKIEFIAELKKDLGL